MSISVPGAPWRLLDFTIIVQTDGDTSPIPTPEPHPDDVPDGDIAITEPGEYETELDKPNHIPGEYVDDGIPKEEEEPDHA